MRDSRNISTALSVAATVLLQSCTSSTDSSNTTAANTTAPALVATWSSDCITTQNATNTTTVTQASGGSSSSTSISNGEAIRNNITFNQDGNVAFLTEYYDTANCNANTLANAFTYLATYAVGEETIANDSSIAVEINYTDAFSTTYSIFQIVNDTELYLGEGTTSTPGNDGTSEDKRFDGLGSRLHKIGS